MKPLKSLLVFLLSFQFLYNSAQTIFVVESVVVDNRIPMNSDSYSTHLLRIGETDTSKIEIWSSLWYPLNNNIIICGNNNSISRVNIDESKVDTLFQSHFFLIDLIALYPNCYFAEAEDETFRYSSAKLYRLNINSKELINIDLGNLTSIEQLNISPDAKYLSFVEYSNFELNNEIVYNYYIYNIEHQELKKIDSAFRIAGENYGGIDDGKLSAWINNETLIFFKQSKGNRDELLSYNLKSESLILAMKAPVDDLQCFSYFKNQLYFISKGNSVMKYNNSCQGEIIYACSSKFDFLYQQLYVK